MSEERPSIAEAMYGKDGPIGGGPSDERTRAIIDSGIARPDPRFADSSRPPLPGQIPTRPNQPVMTPAPGPGAFDAARLQNSNQYDSGLLSEFQKVAGTHGITQRGGSELLELHARATKASEEAYAARLADGAEALERSLPARDLQAARELINDPELTPAELRPWLAQWGNHPLIATMLTRWAAAIRRGY
jgi:hypothetical protein